MRLEAGWGSGQAAAPVVSTAIPGVIAAGQTWTLRFSTPGNNADGIIATEDGGVMVAGNDSRNVVEDPSAQNGSR